MTLYDLRQKIQERIDKIENIPLSRDEKNSSQLELIICKQWVNEEIASIVFRLSQLKKEQEKNRYSPEFGKIELQINELRLVLGEKNI